MQAVLHCARITYVSETVSLVSPSDRSKRLLCFVNGLSQKHEQKNNNELCPAQLPFRSINYGDEISNTFLGG